MFMLSAHVAVSVRTAEVGDYAPVGCLLSMCAAAEVVDDSVPVVARPGALRDSANSRRHVGSALVYRFLNMWVKCRKLSGGFWLTARNFQTFEGSKKERPKKKCGGDRPEYYNAPVHGPLGRSDNLGATCPRKSQQSVERHV